MEHPGNLAVSLALAAVLLPACRSGGAQDRPEDPVRAESDYVLALLRTGPGAADLAREKRAEIMRGHLENIGRLAREGQLLVAGPFGTPNPDPALRGIFVFEGGDLEDVRALCASDPAVAAGVLEPELVPLRASEALHRVHALDLAAEAARPAGAPPSFDMRSYVLFMAPAGAAEEALAGLVAERKVLLLGRLGGERRGESLVLLDAVGPEEARAMIQPALSRLGDPMIFPWHGSASLARLPELAAAP